MSNNTKKTKLFVILGPTAIGKSTLAQKLAEQFNASIINADSLQVYRYLDIGTSKPTKEERKKAEHYMLDVVNPDQDFNAANFKYLAEKEIKDLSEKNKKIIIVGGTFLYVRILLSGITEESELDENVRADIENIKMEKGLPYIYRMLKKVDLQSYNKLNENDYIRIQRALEVYFSSGIKMSELQKKHSFSTSNYEVIKTGIQMERVELNKKINLRVDKMIKDGFIEEVEKIRNMGYGAELKPMKSIGYKEINSFLDNELTFDDAVNLIKQNTRRYAKRQVTWLRRETGIDWYSNNYDYNEIEEKFNTFFSN